MRLEIRQKQCNCEEPSKWPDFFACLPSYVYKVCISDYTSYFVHVALTSFFFNFLFFRVGFFYGALISYNKAIQSQSYKVQMSRRMKLCDWMINDRKT